MTTMEHDTITAIASDHQNTPAAEPQQGQGGESTIQGQQPGEMPTGHDPDDVDLLELKAAQDAAKATEQGGQTQEQGGNLETQPNQPQGDPAKPDDQGKGDGWIPKVRFDQAVSKEREKAEAERTRANYFQGAYDALSSKVGIGGANGQQPAQSGAAAQQQQPQTVDQFVADLQAKKLDAARKFDDGEITAAKLVEIQSQVDEEIWKVRQHSIQATINQVATQGQQQQALAQDEAYVQAETDKLEDEHPYTKFITSKSDWDYLGAKALESLASKGIQIDLTRLSQRDRLVWRREVAVLTDRYGETLTGIPRDKVFQNGGNGQGGQNSGMPALSPQAQARAAKLELSRNMPPNLTNMGHTAPQEVSEAAIAQMTDEEIMALPQSSRDRIMNKGAART